MFKTFNYQDDPHLAREISNLLSSDSENIFDAFREPLANVLGLVNHSVKGHEIGVLLNDYEKVCGYALFTSLEVIQFYVSPDFRMQGHGRAMLEALKIIYKQKGIKKIDISVRDSEQARCFWKSSGAQYKDAESQLWYMEFN